MATLASVTLFLVVALIVLFAAYAYYMSRRHGVLAKLGIPGPRPWPIVGTILTETKNGIFQYHVEAYRKYRDFKAYGGYLGRHPTIYVRDLDVIRDICVEYFHIFTNRRGFQIEEPLDHSMVALRDGRWKRVRSIVSPIFSSGKLKRMSPFVQRIARRLQTYLGDKLEAGEEVELKDALSKYSMDCIACTIFGADLDSFFDTGNRFTMEGKRMIAGSNRAGVAQIFFDFLWPVIKRVTSFVPVQSIRFFKRFVDRVICERKTEAGHTLRRGDFLQLVMEAEEEEEEEEEEGDGEDVAEGSKKRLSYLELQGQALIFIFAGYETVSTVMSFATFLLAMNPECCSKAQEEIDEVLQGESPNYENVQKLPYLDMCINEAIRMYPPAFITDRRCSEDVEIRGLRFPKDSIVFFNICGIHNDPEIYPEPELFKPERFTAEEKAARHPYAHLPFGMGPRNCIGMRLAQLTMKLGLVYMLQAVTPVKCDKSVFPLRLKTIQLEAHDGLWVKLQSRQ